MMSVYVTFFSAKGEILKQTKKEKEILKIINSKMCLKNGRNHNTEQTYLVR